MSTISERLGEVLKLDPSAPALEFEGTWSTWGELAAAADAVDEVLHDRGLGAGSPVGLMLRNRPVAMGALL
ncbi:MAG TPA: AMP-binding protein, partial [Acidimicrobiia bacterium]|nr:AMP-binding protein [Acidimicrobiia bacterium]